MAPSDTPPTIRRATQTDIPAMGRLGALLVQTHHDFDSARFLPVTSGTEHGYGSFLRSQLDEPTVILLVAEREGKVVGYSYASIEGHDYMSLRGPAGVLHDLVVDPAHRGARIGGMLLETTLAALRGRGVPRIVLMTAAGNLAAQRLFARVGFRPTMIEMTREVNDDPP